MKRDFVAGHLGEYPAFFASPRSMARTILRWSYIPLALAMLLAIVLFLNRGPAWMVLQTDQTGTLLVDDRVISLSKGGVSSVLVSGKTVELASAGPMLLASPGHLAMEILPGARVTIPALPGRWFGRTGRGEVAEGSVRILTGPSFKGSELWIGTPEASVLISGSTLSIRRSEKGTRVSVLEGEVRLGRDPSDLELIPEGTSRTVYADGRSPSTRKLATSEKADLTRLRDRALPILRDTKEKEEDD